jgi:hypothetical protein
VCVVASELWRVGEKLYVWVVGILWGRRRATTGEGGQERTERFGGWRGCAVCPNKESSLHGHVLPSGEPIKRIL